MMGPSTWGAMPMKLANTSASSVRGCLLVRWITSAPVIRAAATMEMLTILPRRRRCGSKSFSGIASPFRSTEEQEPDGEGKKQRQAWVHEDERPQQMILELDAQKEHAGERREKD